MKFRVTPFAIALLTGTLISFNSLAAFSPHEVMPAGRSKQEVYVMDAIVRGGDPTAVGAELSAVRWGKQAGFERIVFDIKRAEGAAKDLIPPYFQVGLTPATKKIILDVRGIRERQISNENFAQMSQKSALVKGAYLVPKIQGELASIEFQLKRSAEVETFVLTNPPRIVMDIRPRK